MYPVDGQFIRTLIRRLDDTAFSRASCSSRSTIRADSLSLMLAVISFMTGKAITASTEMMETTIIISSAVKPRSSLNLENICSPHFSNRVATVGYVVERLGLSGQFYCIYSVGSGPEVRLIGKNGVQFWHAPNISGASVEIRRYVGAKSQSGRLLHRRRS